MVSASLDHVKGNAARLRLGWPLSRSATVSLTSVAVFFALWQITPELGWVNGRFTSQPSPG